MTQNNTENKTNPDHLTAEDRIKIEVIEARPLLEEFEKSEFSKIILDEINRFNGKKAKNITDAFKTAALTLGKQNNIEENKIFIKKGISMSRFVGEIMEAIFEKSNNKKAKEITELVFIYYNYRKATEKGDIEFGKLKPLPPIKKEEKWVIESKDKLKEKSLPEAKESVERNNLRRLILNELNREGIIKYGKLTDDMSYGNSSEEGEGHGYIDGNTDFNKLSLGDLIGVREKEGLDDNFDSPEINKKLYDYRKKYKGSMEGDMFEGIVRKNKGEVIKKTKEITPSIKEILKEAIDRIILPSQLYKWVKEKLFNKKSAPIKSEKKSSNAKDPEALAAWKEGNSES